MSKRKYVATHEDGVSVALAVPVPSPSTLVNRLLTAHPDLRRKAAFLFPLMPGSRELCIRFASYVGELPGSSGRSLLEESILSAVGAVEELGIVPFTVATHLRGFAVLCEGLLAHAPSLLELDVRSVSGEAWHPFDGPVCDWVSAQEGPVAAVRKHSGDASLARALRVVLLSRLVGRQDLGRIGASWRRVAGYSTC